MTKKLLIAIVLAILVFPLLPGIATGDEAVIIPDPNLEAGIRDAIGKADGNITQSDLAGISELQLRSFDLPGKIQNLSGLEHCTNLRTLNLGYNDITDLSPLAGLTRLAWLDLQKNTGITNLNPLAGLTDLYYLCLAHCGHVEDISVVANFPDLINLNIETNKVTDISALANCPLERLYIENNLISNISVLTSKTGMIYLCMDRNQIIDISPLAGMQQVYYLEIGDNNITDVTPLQGLTALQRLDLQDNAITDVSALRNNEGLTGSGDLVNLLNNPIIEESIIEDIGRLLGREVRVLFDPLPDPIYENPDATPTPTPTPTPEPTATPTPTTTPTSTPGNGDDDPDPTPTPTPETEATPTPTTEPTSTPTPTPTPNWDKSSIEVFGNCLSDHRALFTVTNNGEDMAGPTEWRLYVDGALINSGSLNPLASDTTESMIFGPYDGLKVRFKVDQRPGHPGKSQPQDDVTCGVSTTTSVPDDTEVDSNTESGLVTEPTSSDNDDSDSKTKSNGRVLDWYGWWPGRSWNTP